MTMNKKNLRHSAVQFAKQHFYFTVPPVLSSTNLTRPYFHPIMRLIFFMLLSDTVRLCFSCRVFLTLNALLSSFSSLILSTRRVVSLQCKEIILFN
ncbi:hypothetical protein FKM82_024173 [Ascaphus truei]